MAATARWLERFVRETCARPEPRIAWAPGARDDASTLRSLIDNRPVALRRDAPGDRRGRGGLARSWRPAGRTASFRRAGARSSRGWRSFWSRVWRETPRAHRVRNSIREGRDGLFFDELLMMRRASRWVAALAVLFGVAAGGEPQVQPGALLAPVGPLGHWKAEDGAGPQVGRRRHRQRLQRRLFGGGRDADRRTPRHQVPQHGLHPARRRRGRGHDPRLPGPADHRRLHDLPLEEEDRQHQGLVPDRRQGERRPAQFRGLGSAGRRRQDPLPDVQPRPAERASTSGRPRRCRPTPGPTSSAPFPSTPFRCGSTGSWWPPA